MLAFFENIEYAFLVETNKSVVDCLMVLKQYFIWFQMISESLYDDIKMNPNDI